MARSSRPMRSRAVRSRVGVGSEGSRSARSVCGMKLTAGRPEARLIFAGIDRCIVAHPLRDPITPRLAPRFRRAPIAHAASRGRPGPAQSWVVPFGAHPMLRLRRKSEASRLLLRQRWFASSLKHLLDRAGPTKKRPAPRIAGQGMGEALNGDAIAVRHLWKRFGASTDPLVAL